MRSINGGFPRSWNELEELVGNPIFRPFKIADGTSNLEG